jgi:acyl-CoA thioesterase-1
MKSLKLIFTLCIMGSLLWMCSTAVAEIRILFLGDSLTAGLGVEKEQAYPHLVGEALRRKGYEDIYIINAGISGSTSASALSRIKWHSRLKPDILVLAMGANDGLRGLSTQEMKTNLDTSIQYALDRDIKVILAGMEMPPNYGSQYTKNFRNVFIGLAQEHKISFMPFLLKDVGGVVKLNQPDGIHPNSEGHRIIAKNMLPYILDNL